MAGTPHVLIKLDGFGYRASADDNAITHAHPVHLNQWMQRYPHTILSASGKYVGLLPHMIGNSEEDT
jgi:2,3-bisphosphoglycerate-independent phosphoglycerate mutase